MPCLNGRWRPDTDVVSPDSERDSCERTRGKSNATRKRNCNHQRPGAMELLKVARCPSRSSLTKSRTAGLVGNFAPAPELQGGRDAWLAPTASNVSMIPSAFSHQSPWPPTVPPGWSRPLRIAVVSYPEVASLRRTPYAKPLSCYCLGSIRTMCGR